MAVLRGEAVLRNDGHPPFAGSSENSFAAGSVGVEYGYDIGNGKRQAGADSAADTGISHGGGSLYYEGGA